MLIVEDEHDDWRGSEFATRIFDQGEGTVLEGAAGVSFGVQVACLLDLQCTFVCDWFGVTFSKDEQMLLLLQSLCDALALITRFQCHAGGNWQAHQGFLESRGFDGRRFPFQPFANFTEPQGNQCQHCDLGREGFGAGDGIFASRIAVDTQLGGACDETADCVDDAHDGDALVHGADDDAMDVLGLAGLTHDDQSGGFDVFHAGEVLGFCLGGIDRGDAVEGTQMLHETLPVPSGIERRTACAQRQVLDFPQLVFTLIQSTQQHAFVGHASAETQGTGNGFRLLHQLLQRPMGVRIGRQQNLLIGRLLLATQVQRAAIRVQHADFAVLHGNEVFGIPVECRCFRCDEGPIIANADDQGRTVACHDQFIGIVGADDPKSPCSIAFIQCHLGGILQMHAFRVVLANQLGNDFGVGLRCEFVSLLLQLTSQLVGIVDCPVVDQGDASGRIHVRMRVLIGLTTMRRPARVRNPQCVAQSLGLGTYQVDAIGLVAVGSVLGDAQFFTIMRDRGDACRIVPAVLEDGQPVQQEIASIGMVLVSDDADDAAALGRAVNVSTSIVVVVQVVPASGRRRRCRCQQGSAHPGSSIGVAAIISSGRGCQRRQRRRRRSRRGYHQ
mmetsp:Transcript_18123/g.51577  ORF Transcript_18123/g.51577 Transcript_18123/m.51577 type:complete len:613 (-) Transcript_18123:286-2124(-)